MEWHDLEKMTVVKLREEAHERDIKGVHGKNKAELIEELATFLGIERPHEEVAPEAVDTKVVLKKEIRDLKAQRDKLIDAHDHKGLKDVRRKIHGLKRQIKKLQGVPVAE